MTPRTRTAGIVLAFLALECVGAAKYKGPADPSAPSAEVAFHKGYKSALTVAGSQLYSVSKSLACDDLATAASLASITKASRAVRMEAGRPVVIMASTTYYYTSSVGMVNGSAVAGVSNAGCYGTVQFTPEAGHAYDVTQHAPFGGRCTIEVADRATGAAPPTLQTPSDRLCAALNQQ